MLRTFMLATAGIVTGAIVLGTGAALLGTPAACVSRAVLPTAAVGQQLATNWEAFKQQAARGPASLVVTEEQATSGAADWARQTGGVISDVRVYFCPDGQAEAAARITYLGRDLDIVAGGTLDVSGQQAAVRITSVRVGNLPGGVGAAIANAALSATTMPALPMAGITGVQFTDGKATITGGGSR